MTNSFALACGGMLLALAACGSDGGVGPADRTHPNGVLGTPTAVVGSPFGISIRQTGEVVGGSFAHVAGGSGATDVATARSGVAFNAAGTLAVIANEYGWVDFVN